MTKITPQDAFKSRKNFEEFMSDIETPQIDEIIKEYPHNPVVVKFTDLTQSIDSFLNAINEFGDITPYIVWTVVNEKENIMKVARYFNRASYKNAGIFVFKASLIDDKIDFKCILKPEIKSKSTGGQAKELQLKYWNKYFEVCDELAEWDFQINPKPQHWQYLSMGKTGVALQLTVNTQIGFIGVDFFINNDKQLYEKLEDNKTEIEKALGTLDWINNQNVKSSRIRKTVAFSGAAEDLEKSIKAHIEMAKEFKQTFSKYL
jgi:hypothetical protein